MKNFITLVGSALVATGISLMSVSCGDKGDDGNAGGKEGKGDSDANPGSGGSASSLEDQMIGYWAPNVEAMAAKAKEELGEDPNAQAFLPMMMAAMSTMSVEVTKEEVTMHAMGQADGGPYKVIKSDPASKTITMEVTDQDGTEEGIATIDGDKLTLSKDGEEFVLDRITKAEFEQRQAAAASGGGIPGLPGGAAPLPVPIPPIPGGTPPIPDSTPPIPVPSPGNAGTPPIPPVPPARRTPLPPVPTPAPIPPEQ